MKTSRKNLKDTSKKLVKVYVSYPAWSESESSWYLLTSYNEEKTSWSNGIWFPKKVCELKKSKQEGEGVLELPKWLHAIKFKK